MLNYTGDIDSEVFTNLQTSRAWLHQPSCCRLLSRQVGSYSLTGGEEASDCLNSKHEVRSTLDSQME